MTAVQPRSPQSSQASGFVRFVDHDYVADPGALAAFRICFGIFLLWTGRPSLRGFAELPDVAYRPPPGLPRIWGSWPPVEVLVGLETLWIVLALALTVGWRTRQTGTALTLITVLAHSVVFSTGKIDHAIYIASLPLLGAWAGWGDRLSIDSLRNRSPRQNETARPGWPLAVLAALLALGFFTTAMAKLVGGWLDPSTQAAERFFRADLVFRDRTDLLAPVAARIESGLVWELVDIATVAFEFAVAAAIVRPAWFRRSLVAAVGFHISVLFVMNISFMALMVVYAVLLLPGVRDGAATAFTRRIEQHLRGLWAVAACLAVVNFWGPPVGRVVSLSGLAPITVQTFHLLVVAVAVVWLGWHQRPTAGSRAG